MIGKSQVRLGATVLTLVGTAVSTAACGGSSLPIMSSSPAVTGAGRHYSYQQAHVPKSKWPNPCRLLPASSAAAAIGSDVVVRRFHTNCYYQPQSAAYPRLTITLLSIGTGADSSYRATSQRNKGENQSSVPNVGIEANLHPVRHLPANRLDVLTRYAHFAVSEQSPVGQRLSPTRVRTLLTTVGRVVARAFAG